MRAWQSVGRSHDADSREVNYFCSCYYAPRRMGGIKHCRDPSVRLSVPPGPGQLGAESLGEATRAVRTADPSAHGRRSAAIGGGISSRRAITCYR